MPSLTRRALAIAGMLALTCGSAMAQPAAGA